MKRARVVPLVVPVVLLAVSGCDVPVVGGDAAPVGTVVEASTVAPGTALAVEYPEGRLNFTVSEPTSDLEAGDGTYDRAVDGASFVGVSWDWDYTSAVPAMRTPGAEDIAPSVRLVADGREYPLDSVVIPEPGDVAYGDSAIDFNGTGWVAVEGEPEDVEDLAIRVEYDGLDQEVPVEFPTSPAPDRGPAQALYRDRTSLVAARGTCPGPTYPRSNGIVLTRPGCQVTAVKVPYQSEVGWVSNRDETWLVVDVSAYPGVGAGRGQGDDFEYVDLVDSPQPFTVTLDGAEPVATVGDAATGPLLAVFAAEAIGSAELEVAGEYPTEQGPVVSARWTVAIS